MKTRLIAECMALLALSMAHLAVGAEKPPPITIAFDHLSTGFELDGVHRDLPCESCHVNAVFKGTPRYCGTCHILGSTFNATPKTTTHIPSSNNCAACHNTIAFRPDVHFNHAEVMGNCVACHNGTIAQGEGPNHLATSRNCAACHSVLTWNPTTAVDHTQIQLAVAGFCIICHNGTQASGKPANHIPTNLECGDCHLTTTWLNAGFNHTGIRTGCASCHNGTKAVGKQGNHMPTTNLCENCHTTGIGTAAPSWVPSIFDHTQMTVATCETCHSGTVKISTGYVSGQPANHVPPIPSTIDCGVCHGNTPSAETWTVLAASIATLHTGLSVGNCLLCHAEQTFAGVPAPYVPMSTSGISPYHAAPLSPLHIPILAGADCSACHGAAYRAAGFGPGTAMSGAKHAFVSGTCDTCHDTGKSFYVGSGTPLQLRPADHITSGDANMVSGDCSMCHETTDWNSTALPAGHMPNPSNLSCAQCHTSAPTDYTPATLAAYPALHTGITSNCGLCHGNNVAALTWFNNFTPKDALLTPTHIPYLSGTDCGSCHSTTTFTAGGFSGTAMSAAKHAFVPTSCDTCHEAGLTFFPGAALNLQGRPADHVSNGGQQATGDCSGCHNTTDWSANLFPAGHMPNPGNQTCTTCHTAISSTLASYATLAGISVLHTGITSNCGLCHGTPAGALTFYNNNDNPKAAVLTPAHIPYSNGVDCGSCHARNFAAGGFGSTPMSAAKHAFVPTTCDTCHEAGLNFYPGATLNLQGRPATHVSNPNPASQATGDCSLCHNTTTWSTPTTLPNGHMPIPGTQICSVCHTGTLTADPASYAQLAAISVLHTGITTGCAQCHGGATPLIFYNNNDNPKAAVLVPRHIPAFSGEDCSACHRANYVAGGFGPMNMTQATHAGVGSTCNGCHEAGLSLYMGAANPGLQGRPTDHTGSQAAPADCSGCHTTANWNSTALPSGHMPNPASTACATCHTAAPVNYTTLAGNAVLHTGISANCSQCHGGTTALTWYNNFTPKDGMLSPAHIPYLTGTDCGSCHSSTTFAAGTFGPMNMTAAKHTFVPTTCDTCHEKGLSFYMGAASPALQGRPADHSSGSMLTGDCGGCHTTGNWNSTALPTGHMPNPANSACTVCHTKAPADYTTATLATNAVLHTGISSGCSTCHGAPSATPPVFYQNFTPKSAVLAPPHIPTGTTACESCHAVSFTSFSGTSMSAAKHAAMFAVIGKTCDACHNAVTPALSFYGVTNLTTRPNDHNSGSKKTADCSQCHSPNDWGGGAAAAAKKITKGQVTAVVAASAATPAAAVAGSGQAVRFAGVRAAAPTLSGLASGMQVSHVGVSANCSSCHNGALAAGKGANHIASNQQCQNCHTTSAWLPAHFDHQGVTAACFSCHNGVQAEGQSVRHIATALNCGACHGTLAWTAVAFSHTNLSGTCSSCHNGVNAVGKQAAHPLTTQNCLSCHNTQSWSIAVPRPVPKPLLGSPRKPAGGAQQ